MPELPEVETVRRGISPHIVGRRIEQVIVRDRRLRWPIPVDIEKTLSGRAIVDVQRRAKYLLIAVEGGTLIVHLGMSGRLYIVERGTPVARHDHVDWLLSGDRALRFTDPRRFGAVLWQDASSLPHPLLASLGPEPLEPAFDAEHLYRKSRGRSAAIKSFLMDGRIVVGVGNIYANEALFLAGIRPSLAAGKLSRPRYAKLVAAVKQVLSDAIRQGGTTLRDFVGGDGKPGYFSQELRVYGRSGQPCLNCGSVLRESRLAQRSTVYCTRCQR